MICGIFIQPKGVPGLDDINTITQAYLIMQLYSMRECLPGKAWTWIIPITTDLRRPKRSTNFIFLFSKRKHAAENVPFDSAGYHVTGQGSSLIYPQKSVLWIDTIHVCTWLQFENARGKATSFCLYIRIGRYRGFWKEIWQPACHWIKRAPQQRYPSAIRQLVLSQKYTCVLNDREWQPSLQHVLWKDVIISKESCQNIDILCFWEVLQPFVYIWQPSHAVSEHFLLLASRLLLPPAVTSTSGHASILPVNSSSLLFLCLWQSDTLII